MTLGDNKRAYDGSAVRRVALLALVVLSLGCGKPVTGQPASSLSSTAVATMTPGEPSPPASNLASPSQVATPTPVVAPSPVAIPSPLPPVVTGLDSYKLPADPAFTSSVNVDGLHFTGATAVHVGLYQVRVIYVLSDTLITFQLGYPGPPPGWVDITVTTAAGTSAANPADKFYFTPIPVTTSISANTAPHTGGTAVHIFGHYFTGATGVFLSCACAFADPTQTVVPVDVVSDTEVTVVWPKMASSGAPGPPWRAFVQVESAAGELCPCPMAVAGGVWITFT